MFRVREESRELAGGLTGSLYYIGSTELNTEQRDRTHLRPLFSSAIDYIILHIENKIKRLAILFRLSAGIITGTVRMMRMLITRLLQSRGSC